MRRWMRQIIAIDAGRTRLSCNHFEYSPRQPGAQAIGWFRFCAACKLAGILPSTVSSGNRKARRAG